MPTYVRLEDTWPENLKVHVVDVEARWLWIASLCFSSRNLTDGVVPVSALVSISGFPAAKARKAAEQLVSARLFERHSSGGYAIHDYLKHQRSRAQIEEIRRKDSRRKKDGIQTESINQRQRQPQMADPDHDADDSARALGEGRGSADWYREIIGHPPSGASLLGQLENQDFAHGRDCVAWAWQKARSADSPWRYVNTVFSGCEGEGHGPRNNPRSGTKAGARRVREARPVHRSGRPRVPGEDTDYAAAQGDDRSAQLLARARKSG